jgi:hypothetical protein
MSGWLVVRTEAAAGQPAGAWARLRASLEGISASEWASEDGRLVAAAWRRTSREFRHDGTLWSGRDSRIRVAWVGVCLEDDGEATERALRALSAERAQGESAAGWNGAFAAAVLSPDGALDLWTSRHPHYTVYVWNSGGTVAASTDVTRLMSFVARPVPDLRAADLFVRCGELIDGLSHVEGVEVLPGAACVRVGPNGAVERSRYWRLRHGASPEVGAEVAVAEIGFRLKAAMRRIQRAYPRVVVPLSGGLDSRILLGLCAHPEGVPSATWGTPGCRDLRYAADFARRVGSPHLEYPFDPESYVPLWRWGVAATGGGVPVQDLFVLPFVHRLAERGDVMIDGLAGDALLGGNFLKRSWLEARSLAELAAATWRWRVKPAEDAWGDRLIRDAGARGAGRSSWERSVLSMGNGPPLERIVDWLLENRVFRAANSGTQVFRTEMEAYAPFFDRDVVDLLQRVPLRARYKHRLYLQVLSRACPPAARVRWQRTGIPPGWGYAANLAAMAAHRALRAAGKPLGIDPFPGQSVSSSADWFRGPWASATRDVLLSQRTLDRGIFAPDAVAALLDAHENGRDSSWMIGSLLALEIFYRLHVDGLLPKATRRA